MTIRRGLAKLETWNEPFDPIKHRTNDVFKLGEIRWSEKPIKEIITRVFDLNIKHPGVAWLAKLPNPYFVLWEQRPDDAVPTVLGRGRLEAMPKSLAQIDVQLELICVPPDEDEVAKAYAAAHRVGEVEYDPDAPGADREAAERFDPLYYNAESDDPLDILQGTLDQLRWDPITLELHQTNLLNGSRHITVSDAEWGSEDFSFENPPRGQMRLRIVAPWTQRASGDCQSQFMAAEDIFTFHWKEISQGLPKPGDQIGTSEGWTIAEAEVHSITETVEQLFGRLTDSPFGAMAHKVGMVPRFVNLSMRAHYEYTQEREEILDLYMSSGIQSILQDQRIEHIDTLPLASVTLDVTTPAWKYEDEETLEPIEYHVGDRVQANGLVWICVADHTAQAQFSMNLFDPVTGETALQIWQITAKKSAVDARNARFFDTPRGARAIRHGLRRLQRIVVLRALCGRLRVTVKSQIARDLTCDDEVTILSPHLPAGQVRGKVVGVEWIMSADQQIGYVDIAIPAGSGIHPDDIEGKPETNGIYYDITAAGANVPVNAFALPITGPRFVVIENSAPEQSAAADWASASGESPVEAISNMPTAIRIYFDPLRQEDLIQREITVRTQPIYIPMGMDLTPEIPDP